MTPGGELAIEVAGAPPLTPRRGWARRFAVGPVRAAAPGPAPPAAPAAAAALASWTCRSPSSPGCCHLNLGTPMRPRWGERWGTCCTMAGIPGIPGSPPTRTWPPIPSIAAKRKCYNTRPGQKARSGARRNINNWLRLNRTELSWLDLQKTKKLISVNCIEIGRKPLPAKRQHISISSGRNYTKYTRIIKQVTIYRGLCSDYFEERKQI